MHIFVKKCENDMLNLPEVTGNNKRYVKLIIGIMIIMAVIMCILDYKEEVFAVVGEHYEDSLPIYCVETDEQVVSLTFDAAWGDEDLQDILKILDKHNCKATFFVTGDWAARYPDAIKRIYKSGHDLGNHGANHKHMTELSSGEMLEEIEGCHDLIKTMTGVDMELFRAPYGDYDERVILAAKSRHYYTIQWDVDSLDWKDYGVEDIIDRVCGHKALGNGSIILLHNGAKFTSEALDGLLTGLEAKGYTFLPVSRLIYRDKYHINHAGRQFK
ncbi:MAG: polysaccharide deacetylase family protein [Clostridium sp.]|nr:polysaccharide deacetylase family protein [Clostridium sp.]MCM1460273.1 polysaccharide deacetylase family protein [Bacteroides sp.]